MIATKGGARRPPSFLLAIAVAQGAQFQGLTLREAIEALQRRGLPITDKAAYCGLVVLTDLINGNENEWEKVYKPSRFSLHSSKGFFESLWETLKNWLSKAPADKNAQALTNTENGEAKVVQIEGENCGVYRDHQGQLHIVSIKCTHLGCKLDWNKDEKTWDCPCHGSRFTYDGKVLNGPAIYPLATAKVPAGKESKVKAKA